MCALPICYERQEDPELPNAVSVWDVSGKNKGVRTALLARRVAGLLADSAAWPVVERDGTRRPARGGDIAVLCRGNAQVADLALALATQGLRVAVERAGLLAQPEVELTLAALRWISDPSDSLAMAEIARLASNGDEWFAGAFDAEPIAAMAMSIPFVAALRPLRDQAPQLQPADLYDGVVPVDNRKIRA